MNKNRRKKLAAIQYQLEMLAEALRSVLEEEMDAFDNLPESIQESDRGESMADAIDNLDAVVTSFDEAAEYLGLAMA